MDKPKTIEEALNIIRTNGWFSYKELSNGLNMTNNQIKYLFCDKFKIKLKKEFEKWLYEKFKNNIKPIEISNEYNNIPVHTIYHYYSKWRKDLKNKYGINKKKFSIRLHKCNYNLKKYERKWDTKYYIIKRMIRDFGLYNKFIKNNKLSRIASNRAKRYTIKNKAFKIFDKYPISLNFEAEKLSILLNTNKKYVKELIRLYKEKKEKGDK